MPIVGEREGVIEVSRLMAIAARTAPKTGGIDDLLTAIVYGDEKESLALEMEKLAEERKTVSVKSAVFKVTAKNVRDSDVVVLIGVRGTKSYGPLDCGACGYATCEEFDKAEKKKGLDFDGPTCLLKALDLGVALGSAVKTASILNTDNRIMYTIGAAAMRLAMIPEATAVIGIPLSAKAKSIYFDRGI